MIFDACAVDRLHYLEQNLREIREAVLADDGAFYALLAILSIIAAVTVFLTILIAAEVSMSMR